MKISLRADNNDCIKQLQPYITKPFLTSREYIFSDENNNIYFISKDIPRLPLLVYTLFLKIFYGVNFDATVACRKLINRVSYLIENAREGNPANYSLLKTAIFTHQTALTVTRIHDRERFHYRPQLERELNRLMERIHGKLGEEMWAESAVLDEEQAAHLPHLNELRNDTRPLMQFYALLSRLKNDLGNLLPHSPIYQELLPIISQKLSEERIRETQLSLNERIMLAKEVKEIKLLQALLEPLSWEDKKQLLMTDISTTMLAELGIQLFFDGQVREASFIKERLYNEMHGESTSSTTKTSTLLGLMRKTLHNVDSYRRVASSIDKETLREELLIPLHEEELPLSAAEKALLLVCDTLLVSPSILETEAREKAPSYYTEEIFNNLPRALKTATLQQVGDRMVRRPDLFRQIMGLLNNTSYNELIEKALVKGTPELLQMFLDNGKANLFTNSMIQELLQKDSSTQQESPGSIRKLLLLIKHGHPIALSENIVSNISLESLIEEVQGVFEQDENTTVEIVGILLALLQGEESLTATLRAIPNDAFKKLLQIFKNRAPQLSHKLLVLGMPVSIDHILNTPVMPPPPSLPQDFNLKNIVQTIKHALGDALALCIPQARRAMVDTFVTNCTNRAAITGAPATAKLRRQYYELMERYIYGVSLRINDLQTKVNELGNKEDPTQEEEAALERGKQELKQMCEDTLKSLAAAGSACAGRYAAETRELYLRCVHNQPQNFALFVTESLREYRIMLLQTMQALGNRDAHNSNHYMKAFGRQLGVLSQAEWKMLNDPFGAPPPPGALAQRMTEQYTTHHILHYIQDKLRDDDSARELYIDWWKENVTEEELERFEGEDRDDKFYQFMEQVLYTEEGLISPFGVAQALEKLGVISATTPPTCTADIQERFTRLLRGQARAAQ